MNVLNCLHSYDKRRRISNEKHEVLTEKKSENKIGTCIQRTFIIQCKLCAHIIIFIMVLIPEWTQRFCWNIKETKVGRKSCLFKNRDFYVKSLPFASIQNKEIKNAPGITHTIQYMYNIYIIYMYAYQIYFKNKSLTSLYNRKVYSNLYLQEYN